MNITLECLPCFVRHTIDVMREFSNDETVQKKILREVLRMIADLDYDQSPPELAAEIHALIRQQLGVNDPYLQIKKDSNALAEKLFPTLEARVKSSDKPLRLAIMYAIAGNIIDSGVSARTSEAEVFNSIEMAEKIIPAVDDTAEMMSGLMKAENILILGDNAGEIVFDRLLLKQLQGKKVVYSVKGAPILNDALKEDAVAAGISRFAFLIDTGVAIPGAVLEKSSAGFCEEFARAEVIIAKGQANYETLSASEDPRIFFALRAKCAVIAKKIGVPQGSFVVLNGSRQHEKRIA